MDRYKKKPLNFTNIQVNRDSRHAETLKARESSRFRRLSILRSMDERIEDKSMESVKAVKCEGMKKPVSRLEMLFKWKQEKKIKQELEKKNMKKPFYTGGQSLKSSSHMNLKNSQLPLTAQPNTSFNTSKTVKSKLLPPSVSSSSQSTRIPNAARQVAPSLSSQSSKIPSTSKLNGARNACKVSNLSKEPTKTFGNSKVSSMNNQVGSIPRTAKSNIKVPVTKTTVDAGMKPNGNAMRKKNLIGIPTLSSTLSKGVTVQRARNQKPVTNVNKKTTSAPVSKLHEKKQVISINRKITPAAGPKLNKKIVPPAVENSMEKKTGYCFKKESNEPEGDEKKISSNVDVVKKTEEKSEINQVDLCSDQSLLNISDMIFDCDVSLIKHAPSFAPADFKFIPPAGLLDFTFENEAFEKIKQIMSRTSTPSKRCEILPTSKDVQDSCKDQSVNEDIQGADKDIDKVNEEVFKNSATEEELQSESDVKLVSDIPVTDKAENVPRETEEKHELLKTSEEVCIDSPLDCVDLNKIKEVIAKQIELMKLEDEESNDDDLPEEQNAENFIEKKPLGAFSKRASLLKNRPVLNSITEIAEMDESIAESPSKSLKDKQNSAITSRHSQRLSNFVGIEKIPVNSGIVVTSRHSQRLSKLISIKESPTASGVVTPRRSQRLSKLVNIESPTVSGGVTPRRSQRLSKLVNIESPTTSGIVTTPRHSMRLQNIASKKCQFEDKDIFSPFEERKCVSKSTPRCSMRLIDLNTPEADIINPGTSKSNITVDFEKLTLEDPENINPEFLIDFETTLDDVLKPKSKKVSLLYSPEKIRKSMRKSVRGDLIVFSPKNL